MAEPSPEQEKQQITQEANELLMKLNRSYIFLQKLNADIESRPFSTRIHGHFDHELKKSQSIISKLSSLLRKYHSFEFSSNLSLEMKTDDSCSPKPIDTSFIIKFKDICLKIEREWRIGTKQIGNFQSKYGKNINYNDSDINYYSDNDTRYRHHRKRDKNNKKNASRSGSRSTSSSPIHSFSNPNSPLFEHSKLSQSMTITSNNTKTTAIPTLNIGTSQSQILQKQQYMQSSKTTAYHTKIGKDFVPYIEEERLNQQIRDINDDLQYLLDINQQINDMVIEQGNDVDDMKKKVDRARDNVEAATDTLTSIRKSPLTYAIMGGLTMAALGAPIILVGVGVKAAVGGAVGLGTVGAFGGSVYAKKSNENMDDIKKKDIEQKLLNEELEKKGNGNRDRKISNHGFQTKPIKRGNNNKKKKYEMNNYNDNDDDEDIDIWDARN